MKRRAAALLLLAVVACCARKEQSAALVPPQTLYERGRDAFRREDYAAAEPVAAEGRTRFAAQPDWNELFALLEAECAVGRKENDRALKILEQTPATGAPLPALRRLMVRAAATFKPNEANETYLAADALAARAIPEARPEIAWRRSRQLYLLNRAEDAKHCAQQAIDGATAAKQTWVLAGAYAYLGYFESQVKPQWAEAIKHYRLAVSYAQEAQAKGYEMRALANLGWCEAYNGDFEAALTHLRPALDLAEQRSDLDYQHVALSNIADVYIRRREFDRALPYVHRDRAVTEKRGTPKDIANAYHLLGNLELGLGHYDAAKQWNAKALQTRKDEPEGVLADLVDKGRILAATGDPAGALEILDRVLASREPEPKADTRWRVQGIEAGIYAKLGRLPEAQRMYEQTLATGSAARESVRGSDSLLAFEHNLLSFYDGYIDLLRDQGRFAEALDVAERSRARALREAVGLPSNAQVDPLRIAREKNATILYYWVGARRSLLWTITPHGIDLAQLPSDDEIDRAADAYRAELQSARHSLANSTLGPKLYEMLVAPAKIAPSSRVIILPDAHLNALNFEALIVPTPQHHYWINDVTVSYSPSLHLLASTQPWKDVRDARLLILGNIPAYGREFPWLRLAGVEMADVAQHFDPSRRIILSGTSATPAAYAAALPKQFQFIHFAAHGTASMGAPLESSVILAPGRNGVRPLSGRDIVRMPLQAELVTISSCNSAGRRSYAGEGLVGLAWAFLGAGAQRVVAAQWEVSDKVAPGMMNKMYAAIVDGVEPAEALRRAKLELLRSNGPYGRPFYWAPFVLYGAI